MQIAKLDMAAEVPLQSLQEIGEASENYALCAYDSSKNVGFFAHLGRWSLDRTLWREQLYVYLPDRTVLAYRGYGRGDCSTGPRAGVLRMDCLQAGKQWRLRHTGPVLHVTGPQLARGLGQEPVVRKLELDIHFHGDRVPFLYPRSDNTSWGHWHYEQLGSMNGKLKFEEDSHEIQGFAFRDHTRGPRDLKNFCGSNWIQGTLPDGSGFALFQTWDKTGREIDIALSQLTITTAEGIESATLLESPGLDSMDVLDAPFQIAFESRQGRIDLVAEPQNTMIFSATSRHEVLLGAARGLAPLVVAEQPLLVQVNGQSTMGHSEICRLMTESSPELGFL
ncbi:MAG: hypothetical protein OXC05_16745 [Halieaceae bacterium]|nr:hypothetical protein [Halieaceae bacterium]